MISTTCWGAELLAEAAAGVACTEADAFGSLVVAELRVAGSPHR